MNQASSILAFNCVSSEIDSWWDCAMDDLSFSLQPCELLMISFDRHVSRMPVADAAMGVMDLTAGEVRFMDHPWQDLTTSEAAKQRGKIGRFFGRHGWVHHLDVDENVTLSQRHHTRRPLAEIETEALELAKVFGFTNGLPGIRPTNVDQRDLQRSACVRMLLGSPPLIVMDEPSTGIFSDVYENLCRQIDKARDRGTAVLWLSADPTVWADQLLKPTQRVDLTTRAKAKSTALST